MDEKVGAVFHCGDIIAPFMKKPFKKLKDNGIPLYAVYGNNDGERAGLKKIFGKVFEIKGDFAELEIEGKKICMFHHLPDGYVEALARSGNYDLILRGHTHEKLCKKVGNTLIINPGEACGYLTGHATVCVIDLDELDEDKVKFLELNS